MRRGEAPEPVPMPDALREQAGLGPRRADALEDRRRRDAYDAAFRRAVLELRRECGRAAAVAIRFGAARPEHAEAVARMREAADEQDRVVALYRRGAPFTVRTWAPLAGAGAGVAPVDRAGARARPADLFAGGPVESHEEGFSDILDAMG